MSQKSKNILGYVVNGLTIVIYFVLLFVLETPPGLAFLNYVGFLLFFSGIILIVLTVVTLRRAHAGRVITSGVFSVVRHPMYLGSILLFISMACFLPHWIMVILSVVNVLYIYWFMIIGDQNNIQKFGEEYRRYMQSVPRANIIAGFIHLLQRKLREE